MRACVAVGAALAAAGAFAAPSTGTGDSLTVRNAAELYAALTGATPGQSIHALGGIYELDRPLVVPDGVALAGDGEMRVDATGTPQGWGSVVTTLRVSEPFVANVVTLGDGASLRGLQIVQRAVAPEQSGTRAGRHYRRAHRQCRRHRLAQARRRALRNDPRMRARQPEPVQYQPLGSWWARDRRYHASRGSAAGARHTRGCSSHGDDRALDRTLGRQQHAFRGQLCPAGAHRSPAAEQPVRGPAVGERRRVAARPRQRRDHDARIDAQRLRPYRVL